MTFKECIVAVLMLIALGFCLRGRLAANEAAAIEIEADDSRGWYPSTHKTSIPLKWKVETPVVTGRYVLLGTGRVSWFGGPNDESEKGNGLALANGRADWLDSSDFYCAFRWNLEELGVTRKQLKDGWVEFRANGRIARARVVDWGPHTRTGRTFDLSYGLINYLGLDTDDFASGTLIVN